MRFVNYLLEEERKITAKKWTAEEIASLSPLSSNNLESAAKMGKIIFDKEKGLGAVPYNQEVVYRGFVGMMLPRSFSRFAIKADREEDSKNIIRMIEQGYGVGSPFL